MTATSWLKPAIVLLFLAALAAVGARQWLVPRSAPPVSERVRQATPEEILTHIRDLNSPLVLVNFWASWCEPCKVEFPHLMTLKKEFEGRGLRLVFISVDDSDDLPAAEAFLKQQQVDFVTFYKGTQSLSFVTQIFPKWSGAVPATILMGPDLQIVDGWEGDTPLKEFQERVQKHLKGT